MKKILKAIKIIAIKCYKLIKKYISIFIRDMIHEPLKNAKLLVILIALLHLLFSPVYFASSKSLGLRVIDLKLFKFDNRLVGMVMFGVILLGLIDLFNLLRIKRRDIKKYIIAVVCLFLTVVLCLGMMVVYIDAIKNLPSLNADNVKKVKRAVVVVSICSAIYFMGAVQIIRQCYLDRKKIEN